uniref:Uncharacterized protein n=1 Tax=Rhizophora mucronata TaxID=61149 RepID=A0A2P2PU78_RHIMU
MIPESVLLW